MRVLLLTCSSLLLLFARDISAQTPTANITVRVTLSGEPVGDVQVSSGTTGSLTNADGEARLRLTIGDHIVRVTKIGLRTAEQRISVRAGRDTAIVFVLEEEAIETEAIIVSSTRTDRRIEDEPLRIEVISREEIEEKLMMTPGDISMMLNETSGLRVQSTAPLLGGASVRIQGLRGRYTQILSDGLPLFGGQTGALGPLQIPPMDLRQVEVIKGVASSLYGSSALGGVVNLLSRVPGEKREHELLVNQSTLGGSDAIVWTSSPISKYWGYTLLASAHRQSVADIDDDGWADLPSFRRALARPRAFWNNGRGASALITFGAMVEERAGGTVDGRFTADGSSVRESLDTRRGDVGAIGRLLLGDNLLMSVRASAVVQEHDHVFGELMERDDHATTFAEAALSGSFAKHTWVAGVALQHENYEAKDVDGFNYRHSVPGVFLQDEYTAAEWLTLSGSARFDRHSEYGSFFNPRFSALLRPGNAWTIRASAGSGYFAPTPWVEEVESVGLRRLEPLQDLEAELARSMSFDIGRTFGALELNATVFRSVIENAVQSREIATGPHSMQLINAPAEVKTHGTELLLRYHREGLHVTATHVFMQSTEPDPDSGTRRDVPLTPRHTAGVVAAWEQEGRGRFGLEFYYTGEQSVDDNPYRVTSEDYTIVGMLLERRVGKARVFLNAENILDTRQTRYDSLLLPTRSPVGRWTTEVWAPLEGRSFNAGIRWQFD